MKYILIGLLAVAFFVPSVSAEAQYRGYSSPQAYDRAQTEKWRKAQRYHQSQTRANQYLHNRQAELDRQAAMNRDWWERERKRSDRDFCDACGSACRNNYRCR